jgi:hypothetical protein
MSTRDQRLRVREEDDSSPVASLTLLLCRLPMKCHWISVGSCAQGCSVIAASVDVALSRFLHEWTHLLGLVRELLDVVFAKVSIAGLIECHDV